MDQPLVNAKTSRQHFYSEPRSILAPDRELTREELEALIAEHGQVWGHYSVLLILE